MKKIVLSLLVVSILAVTAGANPIHDVPGLISYSETQSLYFDSEENALRWIQTQGDFYGSQEMPEGQRRLVESMVINMIPSLPDLVRLHSDFCIMIERSPTVGASTLQLYVRGSLTRLWIY